MAAQPAQNYGDERVLTWLNGIHIFQPWSQPQNAMAAAEPPWVKIFSHGASFMWSWKPSQSTQAQPNAIEQKRKSH